MKGKIKFGFINHKIIITNSKKHFEKLTGFKVEKDSIGLNYTMNRKSIIYIEKNINNKELIKTSIHESTHAIDDIFNIFSFEDKELRAYMTEYVSYYIINKFKNEKY